MISNVEKTTIENCINIEIVRGTMYAGGITGLLRDNSTEGDNTRAIVSNCINSGLIIGINSTGGIIGRAYKKDKIKNCINTGTVKGNTKVGCIVGENDGGTVINCHYDKQICNGEK